MDDDIGIALVIGVTLGIATMLVLLATVRPEVQVEDVKSLTNKCKEKELISPPVSIEELSHNRRVDYLEVCFNKSTNKDG